MNLLLCACEFDLAQLESRHDALDSPSTLGIRVAVASRLGSKQRPRAARAEAARAGRWWRGSNLTRRLFLCTSMYDRGTCCQDYSGSIAAVQYLVRRIHITWYI